MYRHILRGSLRLHKYHGKERHTVAPILHEYDVVFTTYGTLIADMNRGRAVLNKFKWYRVILDEGENPGESRPWKLSLTFRCSSCYSECIDETISSSGADFGPYSLVYNRHADSK